MAHCKNCGNQTDDGLKFCPSCGAVMATAATMPVETPATPVTPTAATPTLPPQETYREEPISTGGYFGIMFLLMLPALNLLLLILWACGGCRKVGKRNFARAVLLWMVIGGVLSAIAFLIGGWIFGDQFNALKESLMQLGGTGAITPQ